jgi:hypothetical protein
MPSVDLLDDAVGIGGPDEGFGFAVVLAEIPFDCGLQIDQRVEHVVLQARRVSAAKKVSTALAQEQEVGVK